MIFKIKIYFVSFVGLLLYALPIQAATQITNIEFQGTQNPNQILIRSDTALEFEKQVNTKDQQIIIELKGAQLAHKGLARKIDTSSFDSKVSLISPYQVAEQDTVRVVIQLREASASEVTQEGNLLKISIPNQSLEKKIEQNPIQELSAPVEAPTPHALPTPQDKLQEFFANRETKRFIGKPITLRVREAEVIDIFRLIGESSGFNIVLGEDIRGKITLSLVDVPWDLALDTVLNTLRLGAERNNNVLRVMTLTNLASEKQEQLKAKKAAEATAPLVTRVFPVSYANLTELQGILSKFTGSGGGDGSVPGALVQLDNRTNSIIVRDIPDNVEKMKKLIEILDTQTPQVLIEAKIIEASEQFVSQIGGTLGFGRSGSSTAKQYFASFSQGNPIDALIGTPGVFADGTAIGTAGKSGSSTFGFTPELNFLPGVQRLNAILKLGESENQLKVVASPKTVVLNKEKGNIIQGTPVLVPGSTSIPGVGTVPVTTVQSANLSLDVKPTVTNDGNILLELAISRDVPQALDDQNSGIAKRSLNTSVVVESGSTLVIGGIYTMTSSQNSSGFPFLRKIPILGWLFGNESETTDRSELFIFITPRIINEKEAGLTG
jgi:type IV pilus assembly protein PilQ